ncbi:MAG: glutamate 5-kinase [Planctomycetaceae bacterium]|nr:glutamate 5-kinase [Planctomycetaceae bacterium]
MSNLVRKELAETAKTIVVKIGTNVLSDENLALDPARISKIAEQVDALRATGKQVVLVSSGSVGAGMTLLGLTERPKDLPHIQAAAATGQAHLIGLYDQAFRRHGYHAAQLLLTVDDFRDRTRYLNIRNTLRTLFEYGSVPIINENDTVSIDEIRSPFPVSPSVSGSASGSRTHSVSGSASGSKSRSISGIRQSFRGSKFSDNDQLAAMVMSLLDQPLLVILSVIDGLYDGDPCSQNSQVISLVEKWDDSLFECVSDQRSSRGTGGMESKLAAVKKAVSVGENVILANGLDDDVLGRIARGEDVGTAFLARGKFIPAWKRWIGFTVTPSGGFVVDAGASKAIVESGKSLLPIGIKEIRGDFEMGEVVSIIDQQGKEFARGLSNYDSRQVQYLMGCRKEEILEKLGEIPFAEAVHRDNLVVTH